ncbi:MAG: hypothetical protein AB8U25_05495 [Rickettsiales endosymbiont of Dermacentor nuttalli]
MFIIFTSNCSSVISKCSLVGPRLCQYLNKFIGFLSGQAVLNLAIAWLSIEVPTN